MIPFFERFVNAALAKM